MRWAWIYAEGLRLALKQLVQYRVDAVSMIVGDLGYRVVRLLVVGLIFTVTPQLGHWGPWEITLMWATAMLAESVGNLLFVFPTVIDHYFHSGALDYVRVRPAPIVLWANAVETNPRYVSLVVVMLSAVIVAAANTGILGSAGQMGLLVVALLSTGFVFIGMRLMLFCLAAWFTRSRVLSHGIAAFTDHSRYPIDIMDQPLRGVLTAIPLAFTVFYPAAFALRPDEYFMPGVLGLPVAAAMMVGGLVMLRFAFRKYQSVGTPEMWGAS